MQIGPVNIHVSPWHIWKAMLTGRWPSDWKRIGIFRNLPWIVPGRWGFFILGFEVGNRNPGQPFGQWLKRVGLWPW